MNLAAIVNVTGTLVIVLGLAQLVPMGVALAFGEADGWLFLRSALGTTAVGAVLYALSRKNREISERDGFVVVTVGWAAAALVGGVPYLLTGTLDTVADAVFESMSGFTTTGASVFTEYGGLGQGILLWRSMTQWFGGMGIIVLALVILPALGIGGMQLYKREVPGPYSEKLTPRLRDTARALWTVYLGITAAQTLLLYLLGMSFIEALNHALTTVSTGGFSTRGDSVGGFQSAAIEWCVIAFMFISGMNFALHYRMLTRPSPFLPYYRDEECLWYVAATLLACAVVVVYLVLREGYGAGAALTKGTFQVVSILTTTGYGSDDYVRWGALPQILLLLAMIAGGSAGSTAGGVKWVRILLVFKYIRMELLRLIHPRVVVSAKLNQARVSPEILSNIFAFIFLYLTTLAAVTLLLALDGGSIPTALGAAAAALGNIGPGLDAVGPMGNYHHLSDYAKWVLVLAMMLGRLELMTVLVLFMPQLWSR
jgi:trk system potassium uptake protein TrkH